MEKYNLKILKRLLSVLFDKFETGELYIYIEDFRIGITNRQFEKFKLDFNEWFFETYNDNENREMLQNIIEKDKRLEFPLISDLIDYFIDIINGELLK